MTKELTSAVLAKRALVGAAYTYFMTLGMAFLFAQAEQSSLSELYPLIIPMLFLTLGLTAFWFYVRLRRCVSDFGGEPQFDHALLRRRATLSILATINVAFSLFGLALLRSGYMPEAYVCLAIGVIACIFAVMYVVRGYQFVRRTQDVHDERHLSSAFAIGILSAIVAGLLIGGLLGFQFGKTSIAFALLGGGVLLAASNIASVVEIVRKREAQLPLNKRVFGTAMSIFGCATAVITSLLACGVFFLRFQSPVFAAVAAMACAIFSFLLYRSAKMAEARFGLVA